uniref:Uncharacterized protein n=1 Tax=Timema cristinae TaxID=61476 RepID=A0A7R9D8W9_TIMCR|nr:unnamed protein product [Timema cristinae]
MDRIPSHPQLDIRQLAPSTTVSSGQTYVRNERQAAIRVLLLRGVVEGIEHRHAGILQSADCLVRVDSEHETQPQGGCVHVVEVSPDTPQHAGECGSQQLHERVRPAPVLFVMLNVIDPHHRRVSDVDGIFLIT